MTIKFIVPFLLWMCFSSCSNNQEVYQILSGNTILLKSGTKVRLINVANSSSNYKLLIDILLSQEVLVTDKNFAESSFADIDQLNGYIFLKDNTCVNDMLEKEGIATSDIPEPTAEDHSPEPPTVVTDSEPLNIEWSLKHVRNTAEVSECYEYFHRIFHQQNIKSLPHIPVLLISREEMKAKSGSRFVVGLAGARSSGYNDIIHTIWIVNNLPKLDFAGVLAHEIMHTWINQNKIKLSDAENEGFCNYGYYMILKSVGGNYANNLIKKMMENPHPLYGVGFRKVKAKIESVGLDCYMKSLLNN